MTHYESLSVLIGAGALAVTVLTLALGLIVRITRRWTQVEERLDALVEKITAAIGDGKEDYSRLERRTDRLDERLTDHEQYHARMLSGRPAP